MTDILRKSFSSAILKSDDTQGIVEAIVNTTAGEPDRQGDVLVPGAWKKAVAAIAQKSPKVVWNHANGLTSEQFVVVGKVIGARELMPSDESLPIELKSAGRGALLATMKFNLGTEAGRDAYSNVAGGYVDEWSVGFLPEDHNYNAKGGFNEIKSAYPLLEISPVLVGASPMTATLSAKSADLQEVLTEASASIDQSTDVIAAADTAHGTPTTRAEGDVATLETKSSTRSTNVATEPTADATVGPVRYLEANEAREMFAEIVKAALRDSNSTTDPETRPTSIGGDVPESQELKAEELVAKGYFSGMARRDGFEPKNISINKYPRGDIDNFSVARFAMAQAYAQNNVMGDLAYRKVAPWETAYIEAGMKDVMVNPITKANMGDMVSGQDGGFLAPEQWNQQLYDLLYPSSILSQVPITRQAVPTRVIHWPVLTSNVTVYYVGENAALTASSPTFRQITATMRKQAVLAYLSNELIRDSAPQADAVLRQHCAIEMALDQDAQALAGNGTSGAPIGLLNQSGVTTSAGPTHLGYTDLVKGIFQVETLNGSTITRTGQAGCTGIIANPVLKKQIASLTDTNARPLWDYGLRNVNISASPGGVGGQMPNPGAVLNGFLNVPNYALSNNTNISSTSPLPITEGQQRIFFGDWRWLTIAERMDIEFMASNVAGNTFANDQTAIRLIRRYDVVNPHPEAFFVLTSVNS